MQRFNVFVAVLTDGLVDVGAIQCTIPPMGLLLLR